jgi:hypothetical protein
MASMAGEVTVDVRIIGQPECCKKYKQAGWKFTYQPGTKFVQADHPLGGKHSVVEVIDDGHTGYECDEIGNAIAMLLNGVGE